MASTNISLPSLLHITIDEISEGLRAREFTSVDLVKAYLTRISEINPMLNAVVETNPEALVIAEELDEERFLKGSRGPLHGVPILIKDNIATLDGMQTTGGSLCLLNAWPSREASVIQRIRDAGAILLGKTNISEWMNFRSSPGSSSGGWSARSGQTLGPYHVNQDPCGSSSGSAVAVAVGLALGSIGTEDAAIILNTIAGRSSFDSYTDKIPYDEIPDYNLNCRLSALESIRVGIPRNAFQGSEAVATTYERSLALMKSAGAILVDNANLDAFADFSLLERDKVTFRDLDTSLSEYLSLLETNPNHIYGVKEIVNYIKKTPREAFEQALASPETTSVEYQDFLQRGLRYAGPEGILGAMNRWNVDAIVVPTSSIIVTSMAAFGGFPIINVPMGFYPADAALEYNRRGDLIKAGPGIPIGIQIIGRPFDEQRLIGYAYAFEQSSKIRDSVKPMFLPKTELVDVLSSKRRRSWLSSIYEYIRYLLFELHELYTMRMLKGKEE
ncbi:hypothetical protein MMC13_007850 [Lambiella insularis]|nr:hypothetical protein [Lambiella insularis]